ncbi:farnesyltransferase, putative [Bodo saltans]|uniref:Squalene synthase n=1 Tax=Bodo saltans TaxID=75058 RepID=A0A0S4JW07_BODSA|nr:farnesyltransferase, putative [Bodo saltans]|eukprot:CUG93596.1 farnesyltransferase, putative [Bodo saltans]
MGFWDLLRVDEVFAMITVKRQWGSLKLNLRDDQEDLKFCYEVLNEVSRSFAAVIMQLDQEMRDAICIFYLVLRALDTIEDDMDVSVAKKKEELPIFHKKSHDLTWCIDGIGKGHEKLLLQQYYRVSREYQKLKTPYQEVISDICERMANGMCHYLENTVQTKHDYDMYCHYVAGLVGHGLTRLFASSGMEDPHLADDLTSANHMGLFLQKTNIIRDYFEDISENPPRIFWPKEIWGNFTDDLHSFKDPQNIKTALECLNAMICDAMQHLPFVVEYMASLKTQSLFLFCAIPQVMAIATLAKLYNNPGVFNSKVKIRKGLACKIMLHCDNLASALTQFNVHLTEMETSLKEEDPSFDLSRVLLATGRQHLVAHCKVDKVSYARSFITRYPALGGQLLYSLIDGVGSYFRKN